MFPPRKTATVRIAVIYGVVIDGVNRKHIDVRVTAHFAYPGGSLQQPLRAAISNWAGFGKGTVSGLAKSRLLDL